jgi:hypothetical protein
LLVGYTRLDKGEETAEVSEKNVVPYTVEKILEGT